MATDSSEMLRICLLARRPSEGLEYRGDVERLLRLRADEPRFWDEPYGRELKELLTTADPSSPLEVQEPKRGFSVFDKMRFLLATAIEEEVGEVFCKECERFYAASATLLERFQRGRGSLEGGGGRRLFCPQQHLLIAVQDWRS